VELARRVSLHHLVYMCAADFDYREIAENWHRSVRRAGLTNHLIYALDAEAFTYLGARALPVYDGSGNLNAWNNTRLQRHIQQAEAERHLAAAAVAASGLDVLLMECTHVMLRDPTPMLHTMARSTADTAFPRGHCSGKTNAFFGCGPLWSLAWLRGAGSAEQRARAVSYTVNSIKVGMVDFYLRWWNGAHAIFSGFGKNYQRCTATLDDGLGAAELANLTVPTTLRLSGGCVSGVSELRMGLLPDFFFNQYTLYSPSRLGAEALAAMIVRAPKPVQRDRLRLDRYDAQDFEELVAAMKMNGLWYL